MTKQPTQTENCPVCGKPENEHKDGLFCCPFCGVQKDEEHAEDCYLLMVMMAAAGLEIDEDKGDEAWNTRA